MVRLVGSGSGNATGTVGVSLMQPDSTTTLGFGLTEGVHLGVRRTVALGADTLTVGDSVLQMPLPTDLDSTPRAFLGRGVLLQHGQEHGSVLFTGATGANYANAYTSTVAATHYVDVMASQIPLAGVTVSLLHTDYMQSRNTLVSISRERNSLARYALTVGTSAGNTILRMSTHQQGDRYRLDTSYCLGELKLQPQSDGEAGALERIGWNVIASRSLGQHMLVDAARHEYVTSNAASDPVYAGVAGVRSQLLEGGVAMHVGHAQLLWRELLSSSATQQSHAEIWRAAWNARLWRLESFYTRNVNRDTRGVDGPAAVSRDSHGLQIEATEHVHGRLLVSENLDLSGSPNLSIGGAWDGDRVALTLTHREAYVPFGTSRGFHGMQVIGIRLRLSTGETGVSILRGGGLPSSVMATTDNYFGGMEGERGHTTMLSRFPRFAVHGRVVDAEQAPVQGCRRAGGRPGGVYECGWRVSCAVSPDAADPRCRGAGAVPDRAVVPRREHACGGCAPQ